MNGLDYLWIAVILISALVGIFRGVVRELFYLAGWFAAFICVQLFGEQAAQFVPQAVTDKALRIAIAYVVVFLGVLVGSAAIANVLAGLIRSVGLGLPDRALGGLFGLLRGGVVAVLAATIAGLTSLPSHPVWRSAASTPVLETAVLALRPFLPQSFAERIRFAAVNA